MADNSNERRPAAAKPRTAGEPPADAKASEPGAAAVQEFVQKRMDEGNEKGYLGEQPHEPYDPQRYSLEGGAPDAELVNPVPRRAAKDETAADQAHA
jgi:hypothetical protein